MSRVGKSPVPVASGVTVTVKGSLVTAKGSLGELSLTLPETISAEVDGGVVKVSSGEDTRRSSSLHGLARNLIANMILGVAKGYTKVLLIEGVGFKNEE